MEDKIDNHFGEDDFGMELFKRDLTCALTHLVFCIAFFALGVWQMGLYNIISPMFFIVLSYGLWTNRFTNNNVIDNLNSAEFILHSILSVYFVGFDLGYQYILFTLAIPIVVQANDKKFLRFNSLRTIISIGIYIFLYSLLHYNILRPLYSFSGGISLVSTSLLIMTVFLMINSQIIANFRNFEKHIKDYKEKELITAQKMNDVQKAVIRNIAGVIEDRDISTGEHTERTTKYVEEICHELVREGKYMDYLTDEMITRIVQSAALHDIGKIKTPDAILNKPGKLTDEEYEIIKQHTVNGGEIIRKVFREIDDKSYENVAYDIVMYHHEKWDGTGYPAGLKEEDIPLPARIMAVADVYDALVSERVYKKPISKEKSLQIILKDSDKHFDSNVVNAFLAVRNEE